MSRGRNHLLKMIFANYVTFLSLITLLLGFILMSWLDSRNRSWDSLIDLNDCTLNMCNRPTL